MGSIKLHRPRSVERSREYHNGLAGGTRSDPGRRRERSHPRELVLGESHWGRSGATRGGVPLDGGGGGDGHIRASESPKAIDGLEKLCRNCVDDPKSSRMRFHRFPIDGMVGAPSRTRERTSHDEPKKPRPSVALKILEGGPALRPVISDWE